MAPIRHGRRARVAAALVATASVLAAVVPSAAMAAGGGATVVRGIQHEFGSCGNGEGYLMEGSLEGCWYVLTFEVKPMPLQATMLAHGEERFDGCLGNVCGSFATTYTYTARFDGATELHGRCHHPIVGELSTGGFAGARGELSFTDVVDAEPFSYPYWGNIQLGRGDGGGSTTSSTRATATRTSGVKVATAPC